MSMQMDYAYPRQVDDIQHIKTAISHFQANMTKMMLLMKEFGTTLENVSQSFRELTSCSFSRNEEVKHYVETFREEVSLLKDGSCFKDYNKNVHESVAKPIEELKKTVKETEKQKAIRERTFKKYQDAKNKVDKVEKEYAKKSKPLTACGKYPQYKEKREGSLQTFQTENQNFQTSFGALVDNVENMTSNSLKQYLLINGEYMAAVLNCLTKCEEGVVSVVSKYKAQKLQERRESIARECSQFDEALERAPMNGFNGPQQQRAAATGGAPAAAPVPAAKPETNLSVSSRGGSVPIATPQVVANGPPQASVEAPASAGVSPIGVTAPADLHSNGSEDAGELSEPLTERQLLVGQGEGDRSTAEVHEDPTCEPPSVFPKAL